MGLKIESSSNLKIIHFLDVTLNLSNNAYKPFRKSMISPKVRGNKLTMRNLFSNSSRIL